MVKTQLLKWKIASLTQFPVISQFISNIYKHFKKPTKDSNFIAFLKERKKEPEEPQIISISEESEINYSADWRHESVLISV